MTATAVHPSAPAEVDPRFEQRRRQVVEERRRRWVRRGLVVAALVAVAVGAWALTRTAVLDVDALEVVGADRTGVDGVVTASGIAVGDPLLDLDLDGVATDVEALPWVARATVERDWRSGMVRIVVQERQPAAALVAGEQLAVVDAGGRVLAVGPRARPAPAAAELAQVEVEVIPAPSAVVDERTASLVAVATSLTPGVRSRVVAIRSSGEDVELVLQPTGTVRFGPAVDVEEKVRTLQTTLAEAQLDCLAVIDVRVPDTAVLTREPTCA